MITYPQRWTAQSEVEANHPLYGVPLCGKWCCQKCLSDFQFCIYIKPLKIKIKIQKWITKYLFIKFLFSVFIILFHVFSLIFFIFMFCLRFVSLERHFHLAIIASVYFNYCNKIHYIVSIISHNKIHHLSSLSTMSCLPPLKLPLYIYIYTWR